MGLDARPGVVEVFAAPSIDTRAWQIDDIDRHRDYVHAFYVQWHHTLTHTNTLQ